jgi:hypothetical protein
MGESEEGAAMFSSVVMGALFAVRAAFRAQALERQVVRVDVAAGVRANRRAGVKGFASVAAAAAAAAEEADVVQSLRLSALRPS